MASTENGLKRTFAVVLVLGTLLAPCTAFVAGKDRVALAAEGEKTLPGEWDGGADDWGDVLVKASKEGYTTTYSATYNRELGSFQFQKSENGNFVYRTDDGGKSWKTVCEKFPAALGDWGAMWFADTSNGCVVWNARSFAATKDGGKTWTTGQLDKGKVGGNRGRVQLVNAKVGWLLPPSGTIHVTRDGGETWQPQPLGHAPTQALDALHFADASLGHVLLGVPEAACEVRRTTDGGKNWHSLGKLKNPSYVRGVSFPTRRHGWVVGHKGYIEHYAEPDAK